jgi:hypothetical protein
VKAVSDAGHDPVVVATNLAAKLATRSRHVCLLFGAGTSCAAGLPDVGKLLTQVLESLEGETKELAARLYEGRNLEEGLSRLRRIRALLADDEEFAGFNQESARELESRLTAAIIKHLSRSDLDVAAATALASWAAGEFYTRPIELFTVNYDLLFETGLEAVGASYFDGFVGTLAAHFRPELVDARAAEAEEILPSSFVRLWKLHGSLNWLVTDDGRVVRTGGPVPQEHLAAIYPSDEKYDESRRVPFVVLHDRLRRALAEPETLTLVCGYSFGDAHLNEVIFDAARRYPRSEIAVFCYSSIPTQLEVNIQPNITVVSASEAIVGGERRPWKAPVEPVSSEVWDGAVCSLGDFAAFSRFLAKAPRTHGSPGSAGVLTEKVAGHDGD